MRTSELLLMPARRHRSGALRSRAARDAKEIVGGLHGSLLARGKDLFQQANPFRRWMNSVVRCGDAESGGVTPLPPTPH